MDDTVTSTPQEQGQVPAPVPVEQPVAVAEVVVPAPRPKPASRFSSDANTICTTGRRKEAIARVRMTPGTGKIVINNRGYEDYFPRETWRVAVRQPLLATHQLGKYDVAARVHGGGISGQAGAVRLGIARAILQLDEAHRVTLRGAGLLTRDPRMKERKKYGQKGARKRFQWTKR